MRARRNAVLCAALIVAVTFAACSTTAGFRKAAAASKLTAEEAYDVVYTAYLRGHVTVEVKDKAARLRDRYTTVQSGVVRAITDSQLDEATRLLGVAGALTTEIINIVIEHKLEEGSETNESG